MEFMNLLEGETVEEKMAGLILSYKYIKTNNSINLYEILQRILLLVKPHFLIQMLYTNYEINNEITIKEIVILILQEMMNYSTLINYFINYYEEIFEMALTQNEFNSKLYDIVLDICEVKNDQKSYENIFIRTLNYICESNSESSYNAFNYIIELTIRFNFSLRLNQQTSQQLRDLLIQGLHSSAKDNKRDTFLIGLMVFLSKLDSSWTIEPDNQNKFVMLIISLISGEYRLLLQELLTINEETIGEESKHIDKHNQDENKEDKNSYNHCEQEQQMKIQLSNIERIKRILNLSFVCYEIFDNILKFLVGDDNNNNDNDNNDNQIDWQELSSTALQLIQKEMNQTIQLFFQFLHSAVGLKKSHLKNNNLNFNSNSNSNWILGEQEIETVIKRGLLSFIKWIREDESLYLSFIDSYEEIITNYSKIPIINYKIYPYQQITKNFQYQVLSVLFNDNSNKNHDNDNDDTLSNNLSELRYIDKKYAGSIGLILLIRNKYIQNDNFKKIPTNKIDFIKELIIDPFVITLDCLLRINENSSMGDKITNIAISSTPYIHSILTTILLTLKDKYQHFTTTATITVPFIELNDNQQYISLCLMMVELLHILLTSETNQMKQSLQTIFQSSDPNTAEYLQVNSSSWIELIEEIKLFYQLLKVKKFINQDQNTRYFRNQLKEIQDIFKIITSNRGLVVR